MSKIFQIFGNYGISIDGKISIDNKNHVKIEFEKHDGEYITSKSADKLENPYDLETKEWYEFEKLKLCIENDKLFIKKLTDGLKEESEVIVIEY